MFYNTPADFNGHEFMGHTLTVSYDFLRKDLTIWTTNKQHGGETKETLTVLEWLNAMENSKTFHFGTLKELFIDPILDDADEEDDAKAVEDANKETTRILKWHKLDSRDDLESKLFFSVKGENLRVEDCEELEYDAKDKIAAIHHAHENGVLAMIEAWAGYDRMNVSSKLA